MELAVIPIELTTGKDMEGHSKGTWMSVNNLVSYLIGWGELVKKWVHRTDNSLEVDFPETGFKWNELGRLAQKFYVDYQELDYPSLLARLDKVVADLASIVDRKSNAELYETLWYNQWTLGRMIQFNSVSPYKNAQARIRKWKKEKPTAGVSDALFQTDH